MYPKYAYPISDLIDRLSIVLMKSIFISEHKEEFKKEMDDLMFDLNHLIKTKNVQFDAEMILAILVAQLSNREIWLNESKARLGDNSQDKFLKLTHSINGIRNTAKSIIAQKLGDRKDLKIDCLAAEFKAQEFTKTHGDWDVYADKRDKA